MATSSAVNKEREGNEKDFVIVKQKVRKRTAVKLLNSNRG